MAILDDVKTDLGITHTDKDSDISAAILTAKKRLEMMGVESVDDTDDLTATAIKLFCRSWLNYQGDAARHEEAFNKLADAMTLCSDYNEEDS